MEQGNGCLGGQQYFCECLPDFKWFPGGGTSRGCMYFDQFSVCFGDCFVFLTIAFQYVILFCVCMF